MFNSCRQVTEWMSGFNKPWGIAGGWAIDLFVGEETRVHSDIEIAILREDQYLLKNALPDWSFEKVVSRELIPWGWEWLELPIHEIHGIHKSSGKRLEVLLNETKEGEWIFRRDPSISFSESLFILETSNQTPILNPAIVLLYKAKMAREKDHADFFVVEDLLHEKDKEWLLEALHVHVPGHQWINELSKGIKD